VYDGGYANEIISIRLLISREQSPHCRTPRAATRELLEQNLFHTLLQVEPPFCESPQHARSGCLVCRTTTLLPYNFAAGDSLAFVQAGNCYPATTATGLSGSVELRGCFDIHYFFVSSATFKIASASCLSAFFFSTRR